MENFSGLDIHQEINYYELSEVTTADRGSFNPDQRIDSSTVSAEASNGKYSPEVRSPGAGGLGKDGLSKSEPFEQAKPEVVEAERAECTEGSTLARLAGAEWLDSNEVNVEQVGGKYCEVRKDSDETHQAHEIPAFSATPEVERKNGPAISMTTEDHRQTASCGSSIDAQHYRDVQKDFVSQGKAKEAFEMDVADIRDKFGDKYDGAIKQARAYADKEDWCWW